MTTLTTSVRGLLPHVRCLVSQTEIIPRTTTSRFPTTFASSGTTPGQLTQALRILTFRSAKKDRRRVGVSVPRCRNQPFGLSAVTAKLKVSKLAIVGLGGTGSYILDLVAETPVGEIHLFDDDVLLAHNAFRTPGAASFSELERKPKKVDYLSGKYSAMRRKIVAASAEISHDNVDELQDMDFVFIAADGGSHTKTIVEALESWSVPSDAGWVFRAKGTAYEELFE